MKANRLLTILFCLIIVLAFSGCDNTVEENNNEPTNNVEENNVENNTNNQEETNNTTRVPESDLVIPGIEVPDDYDMSTHYTLNFIARGTNNPDVNKYTLVRDALQDKFNITFDFDALDGTGTDMDLAAAANVVPECGWVYAGDPAKAYSLYNDGLIRSIPMEYVQKYAPWYWKVMQDDKSFHPTMLVPGTEDEYFTLYALRYGMLTLGNGLSVRLDWLENLGIEPKGTLEMIREDQMYITDEAYLLDEFTDLIYDFTFSDPDMNGENDTYGYNAYGLGIGSFAYAGSLYSAFGAYNDNAPNENGWAVPLIYSDQNFNFLRQLGIWKDMGVIRSDFATKAINDATNLWSAGKVGVTSFEIKSLALPYTQTDPGEWNDEIPLVLLRESPESKILFAPPLLNNDGTGGSGRAYENFIRSAGSGYFLVRSDVDDEKLKRILMLMDYISANPDGVLFCLFGVKDVNWEHDEAGSWSVLPQDDLPDDQKWEFYNFFATPGVANYSEAVIYAPDNKDALVDNTVRTAVHQFAINNWPELHYCYVDTASTFTWADDTEFLKIENMRSYSKAYKAARTAMIESEGDLDTIWDNLMDTLNNSGFQEYLIQLNTNSYLRDELFFDGIALTPAEKFPLD